MVTAMTRQEMQDAMAMFYLVEFEAIIAEAHRLPGAMSIDNYTRASWLSLHAMNYMNAVHNEFD